MVMPAHKEGRQDWETPDWLFDHWDNIFNFNLDVCAMRHNSKCQKYYSPKHDSLKMPWHMAKKCWMNPPYGRGQVEKWVEKAYKESLEGCLICALLPVSTSSRWWQQYVNGADFIQFLPKRIKFKGATGSPSFDNAIVIWGLKYVK